MVSVTASSVRLEDVLGVLQAEEPNYSDAALLGADALPYLAHLVRGEDALIASKAAYLAGVIGGSEAIDVLLQAAQHRSPEVRIAAIDGAEALPGRKTQTVIGVLRQDSDASVRQAAWKAWPGTIEIESTTGESSIEVIDSVAKKLRVSRLQAARTLESFAQLAYREATNAFSIPGIGRLVLVERKARIGRDPKTGEQVTIPAKRVLKFRHARQERRAPTARAKED